MAASTVVRATRATVLSCHLQLFPAPILTGGAPGQSDSAVPTLRPPQFTATHRIQPLYASQASVHNGCRKFGPSQLALTLGRSNPRAFLTSVPRPAGAAPNPNAYIFLENIKFRRKIMIFAAFFNFCAGRAPGISWPYHDPRKKQENNLTRISPRCSRT